MLFCVTEMFPPSSIHDHSLLLNQRLFVLLDYHILNLNGLRVICQIDNTSPKGGGPGGKLVPGSHKRCKLGHTVIRHFNFRRGDQRIREVVLVPDRLWNETTFVRFFAS